MDEEQTQDAEDLKRDIEQKREDLAANIVELRESVRSQLSVQAQIERHPRAVLTLVTVLGAVTALGALVGLLFFRMTRTRRY
jgi:type VI protein secretion system component VasF